MGAPTPPGAPQQGPGGTQTPPRCGGGVPGWDSNPLPRYSLSPEELHPQKGKDNDEEEEEEEEADDGLHGVEEGDHQVPQGSPVPAGAELGWGDGGGTRGRGGTRDGGSAPRDPTTLAVVQPLGWAIHRRGDGGGGTGGGRPGQLTLTW